MIKTRIRKTIEHELADDPYAQHQFSELLRRAIEEADALFDHVGRAREVFQRKLDCIADGLPWLRTPPRWKLLTMKRQWGSCSPQGLLNLNPHLVKAPASCIDYVLLHELCHLRFHHHGKTFYRPLSRHMPNWEFMKQRLDETALVLLTH
jgi:predicted metal-dependent hydrolase